MTIHQFWLLSEPFKYAPASRSDRKLCFLLSFLTYYNSFEEDPPRPSLYVHLSHAYSLFIGYRLRRRLGFVTHYASRLPHTFAPRLQPAYSVLFYLLCPCVPFYCSCSCVPPLLRYTMVKPAWLRYAPVPFMFVTFQAVHPVSKQTNLGTHTPY